MKVHERVLGVGCLKLAQALERPVRPGGDRLSDGRFEGIGVGSQDGSELRACILDPAAVVRALCGAQRLRLGIVPELDAQLERGGRLAGTSVSPPDQGDPGHHGRRHKGRSPDDQPDAGA